MALLSYTNRTLYSTSVHNNWLRSAAKDYALANGRRACFNGNAKDYGEDVFYLYYTGDTDTVHYAVTDSVTFTINSVGYPVTVGDGTFTVSGLTANTVYEVTTTRADSYTAIYWLAFQTAITSTTPPTFTDATIPTVTDFSDMYDALAEAEIAQDILPIPHAFSWFDGLATGDPRDVWHGGFIGGQDTLTFTVTTSGSTGATVRIIVNIDTVERFNQTYSLTETTTTETIDLSALSLTAGAVHRLQIICDGDTARARAKLLDLYTSSSPASPLAATAEFSRGDTVAAAGLNFMTNALVYAHPISGTTPMIRELPAMRSADISDASYTPIDYYYLKHTRQFLRYEAFAGSGTPQIIHNGGTIDLSADTGTQVYDLTNLSDLAMGELYQVTNCKFAIEDVTDA